MEEKDLFYIKLNSGARLPRCIYGAAEKKDAAQIYQALEAGYRGIDSACQPHNYHEDVVGEALARALSPIQDGGLGLSRSDLWVQTKFTTPAGQTDAAPYNLEDSVPQKVYKSLEMSLAKLRMCYVDVLLLHGPMPTFEQTLEIWRCLESHVGDRVHHLGVCNVSLAEAEAVWHAACIKPIIIQNRFWERSDYGIDIRRFCRDKDMVYQPFWVAKANRRLLQSQLVGWFAQTAGRNRVEALFVLLAAPSPISCQVCILTGSSNLAHLQTTLDCVRLLESVPSDIKMAFVKLLVQFLDERQVINTA